MPGHNPIVASRLVRVKPWSDRRQASLAKVGVVCQKSVSHRETRSDLEQVNYTQPMPTVPMNLLTIPLQFRSKPALCVSSTDSHDTRRLPVRLSKIVEATSIRNRTVTTVDL